MQNGELTVEANFYTSKPRRNDYHHRGSQSAEEATEKKENEQQTSEHQASLTQQRDNPIASPVKKTWKAVAKKKKKGRWGLGSKKLPENDKEIFVPISKRK